MSISYRTILNDYSELDNKLWGGAADKWHDATDETKEIIWNTIQDIEEFDSLTQINDYIWFDCDELFYPEEDVDYTEDVSDWFYNNCLIENFDNDADKWIDHLIALVNQEDDILVKKCIANVVYDDDDDDNTYAIIADMLSEHAATLLHELDEEMEKDNKSNEDVYNPVDHKTISAYEDVINQVLRFKYNKEDGFAMFATSVVFDFSCLNLACHDCRNHNEYVISNIRILTTDQYQKMKFIIGNDEYNSFESFKNALFDVCNMYLEHLNKVKPYNV